MEAVVDIVGGVFIVLGVGFSLVGAFGMIRLPDVFTRMHAAGIIDTLGIGLIFIGLMPHAGFSLVLAKLVLILVFVLFTSPTATHALARATQRGGIDPLLGAAALKPNAAKSGKEASSKT